MTAEGFSLFDLIILTRKSVVSQLRLAALADVDAYAQSKSLMLSQLHRSGPMKLGLVALALALVLTLSGYGSAKAQARRTPLV